MKKWLLVLIALLVIAFVSIYLFVPRSNVIVKSAGVTATQEGALRYLSSYSDWKSFWPTNQNGIERDSSIFYSYDGYDFFLDAVKYNSVEMTIRKDKDSIPTALFILPLQKDSFRLQWTTTIHASTNPIKRVSTYFETKNLGNAIDSVLQHMAASLSKVETIYGVEVRKEKVPFQHFVSARRGFTNYPTTDEIYAMIDEAKVYAAEQGAKEIDHPIINIVSSEEAPFLARVAIPIDKDIPNNEHFAHKWMMKGGNILTAEVRGGTNEINKAVQQANQYITDYSRSVIVIPFQMLITDRRVEKDSTKWVTRLYFPVV